MQDRRKRYNRPISIIIAGSLFLLFPLWNYLTICISAGYPYWRPLYVFGRMNVVVIALMVLSLGVGLGLLLVRRWGWRLLFLFSAVLIGYNLWTVLRQPNWFNLAALINTTLALAAAIYFLRPDISAPYMKMYPRGWRFERRHPINHPVSINGKDFITRDLSIRGFYVDWPDCSHEPGEEVSVIMDGMEFAAGVVRVDENGAGFAFREHGKEGQSHIRMILQAFTGSA